MKKNIFLILIFSILTDIGIIYAFNISPHRHHLNVSPGKTYTISFQIVNVYDYKISIEPSFYNKKMPEQNYDINLDKWIKIKPKKFILKPKQTKKVTVKISVPRQILKKSVVMISFPIENLEQKNSPVQLVVSVPVYINVKE